jgi:hypothetical protein
MTIEQFNLNLRETVRAGLPGQINSIKSILASGPSSPSANDPRLRLVDDIGGVLAESGNIPIAQRERINNIAVAIYKNRNIDAYIQQQVGPLLSDQKAIDIFGKLLVEPGSVSPDDFNYVFDNLLQNDALTIGPLEILLADPDVRDAMGFDSDAAAAQYIANLRQTIASVETWTDWLQRSADLGFLGPFLCGPTFCAVAVVWAVVETVALAVNYAGAYALAFASVVTITVASANGIDQNSELGRASQLQPGIVDSVVRNETPLALWVVIQGPTGFKRVPIMPGSDSMSAGIMSIEAILIGGGELNGLSALGVTDGSTRTSGAYVLAHDTCKPAIVTITMDGKIAHVEANEIQKSAEHSGRAGFSDLMGGGPAGDHYDSRWTLNDTAAAIPVGFNVAELHAMSQELAYYSRTRRLASNLESVYQKTVRLQ